ncbi:MAG: hypothetical protein ACO3X4_04235 [Pelagibacteraceae bacterium]
MDYKAFYLLYRGSGGAFHEFLKAELKAQEEAATSSADDDTKWYKAYYKAAQMGCSPITGEIEVQADRLALL